MGERRLFNSPRQILNAWRPSLPLSLGYRSGHKGCAGRTTPCIPRAHTRAARQRAGFRQSRPSRQLQPRGYLATNFIPRFYRTTTAVGILVLASTRLSGGGRKHAIDTRMSGTGRRSLPNRDKQPLGLHEGSPRGNNPFSPTMPRRPKKHSAANQKSPAPPFDRSKGKMKPWNTVDDIPLDEEDECASASSRFPHAYTDRNLSGL